MGANKKKYLSKIEKAQALQYDVDQAGRTVLQTSSRVEI